MSTALIIQFLIAGIISYIQIKDLFSILASIAASILVLLTFQIAKVNINSAYLYIAALTLVLSGYFGVRYALNSGFTPLALMLILSASTFAASGVSWILDHESKGQKS